MRRGIQAEGWRTGSADGVSVQPTYTHSNAILVLTILSIVFTMVLALKRVHEPLGRTDQPKRISTGA